MKPSVQIDKWYHNSPVFYTFHVAVLIFAVFLIFFSCTRIIAQTRSNERIQYEMENLERRIVGVENLSVELNAMDRRLVIIETLLRDSTTSAMWGQMATGGVGLILLRELIKAVLERRKT